MWNSRTPGRVLRAARRWSRRFIVATQANRGKRTALTLHSNAIRALFSDRHAMMMVLLMTIRLPGYYVLFLPLPERLCRRTTMSCYYLSDCPFNRAII